MSPLASNPMPERSQPAMPVKRDVRGLLIWLLVTFAASASAVFIAVDRWYAGLVKPAWNPPAWVFGPVWTTLYAMMAVAAWLVWREGGWKAQKRGLGLYLVQWALNVLWTPLFFGLHQPGLAFCELLVLDVAVLATLAGFWRVRRLAATLLVPYLVWIMFASYLNYTIWALN